MRVLIEGVGLLGPGLTGWRAGREASTSLCAYDASFTAGLLETASQVAVERRPVVLVAYDQPYPEPLRTARAVSEKFAVALLLTAQATPRSLATLELEFRPQAT